jgi:hypothetical protein
MIMVHLRGGLGNQMFQYAAGRRLALHHGTSLKLDVSECLADASRPFALDVFNIQAEIASPGETQFPSGGGVWWWALSGRKRLKRVTETHFNFEPQVLHLSDDVLLDGYWQSEKYFQSAVEQVRSDFSFHEPPSSCNLKVLGQIGHCESVALHIRRGDYVANPQTLAWHGVCPKGYYLRCIDMLRECCQQPTFFVFSDDMPWVRSNLDLPGTTVLVDHNDVHNAWEDLRLISSCRHHIIANSSFSWWGAWLAETPGQIVMAPDPWFSNKELDDRDLIPERWTRVDCAV